MALTVRVVIAEMQRQRAVVITHGAPMIIFVCLIIFVYLFAVHQKLCLALQILRVERKGVHDHNFFCLAGIRRQRHTVAQALISHIFIRHRAALIVSIAFIRRDFLFKGIDTGIGILCILTLSGSFYTRPVHILPCFAVRHLVPVFVRSDGQFHPAHRKVLDRNFEGTGPCRIVRHWRLRMIIRERFNGQLIPHIRIILGIAVAQRQFQAFLHGGFQIGLIEPVPWTIRVHVQTLVVCISRVHDVHQCKVGAAQRVGDHDIPACDTITICADMLLGNAPVALAEYELLFCCKGIAALRCRSLVGHCAILCRCICAEGKGVGHGFAVIWDRIAVFQRLCSDSSKILAIRFNGDIPLHGKPSRDDVLHGIAAQKLSVTVGRSLQRDGPFDRTILFQLAILGKTAPE